MLLLAWGPLGRAAAQAQQISRLTYREPNSTSTTDVEKRAATETVGGTSFTYGNYSSSATGSTTNPITEIFQLTSDQQGIQLDARMLIWRQNNQGVAPAAPSTEVNQNTTYAAFVTLTFTRDVTNLRLVMQDIDKGTPADGGSNFTDQVAFRALNAANQYVDLTGSNIGYGINGANTSSTVNTFDDNITIGGVVYDAIRGTDLNGEVSSNPSRNGNVTVTFPQPVRTVRLAFRNLNTSNPIPTGQTQLRLQTFGIEEIS
ncbi:hypothetical protein SAMN02746009_03897 [Hymenobacter psychrotolerans DSM 18569]|uniref:Uncharacterized protein n=2 Tax=Hymenobacter psychrotolerans TaxID=344998 RepID=A0A1M7FT07_9BACT|nr:hypothetical protein SAMN02746009_03897 [Hymenobacter psychrotolerans DSM 18569]